MASDPHSLVAPYALHALDDGEGRQFEEHLAGCERCREELAGLKEAAAGLAYGAGGPAPPPQLRERILTQARGERQNVASLSARRRKWTLPLGAAAAVAAAVAIGVGTWAATRPSESALAQVLSQSGSRLLPMGDSGAVAVAPNGDAALALNVPPAPNGKTYEIWVIRGGTAQRAGTFDGGSSTDVRLDRPAAAGSVVAVTLERDGGVDRPTQSPLMATKAVS
jgi:anti-sigma-K factor RskA